MLDRQYADSDISKLLQSAVRVPLPCGLPFYKQLPHDSEIATLSQSLLQEVQPPCAW